MNKLDVIIPHLNFEDFLIGIKTLRKYTPNLGKVILIDACGNHGDLVAEGLVDFQIRTQNLGFAKAMNTGLRLSDAEYVMCLNDDVIFFNNHWWEGIEQTFHDYSTALCVNPSSVCDPDGTGGTKVMDGFEYKEEYTDEEYFKLINPSVIDGICMWGTVFKRDRLDSVGGVIPGKAWFDERFYPGGGEDYDLNRRAYLSGMRCLGTGKSYVWHHWFKTKHPISGEIGAKDDSATWLDKWTDGDNSPDLYGNDGKKEIPLNIVRE